jgi:hypothetical protein
MYGRLPHDGNSRAACDAARGAATLRGPGPAGELAAAGT